MASMYRAAAASSSGPFTTARMTHAGSMKNWVGSAKTRYVRKTAALTSAPIENSRPYVAAYRRPSSTVCWTCTAISESALPVALVHRAQRGRFRLAGRAPACPEVQPDRPAPEVGQPDRVAVEVGEGERGAIVQRPR